MKLKKLLEGIDAKIIGSIHRNVEHLTNIASDCNKTSIFFCLKGKQNNGADYLPDAVSRGCKVVVTEIAHQNNHITQIVVEDARKAMSQIAANFYGKPADKLKIIGVTGTNGKTTVCSMVAHILSKQYKVATIGTNGANYLGKKVDTFMTTPDPIVLHKLFAQMLSSGVQVVVMEMSAHAIFLQKLWGIVPDIVAFTNLSQDHLDYFENMDNYFAAKTKLFAEQNYNASIICTDTVYGKKLLEVSKNVCSCSTYGNSADIFVIKNKHTSFGQSFDLSLCGQTLSFNSKVSGSFNLQNMVVAIAITYKFGINQTEIQEQIASFDGVDGRYESVIKQNIKVVIDYAHTPAGLENLLVATKQSYPKEKLICVFGCGGNRDITKRPIMGAISEKYADQIIITTDNPRYEDNYKIATDIISGFSKKKWQLILDRGQAIRQAIEYAKKGGVVVIAGKGAENYMEIKGTKIEFSDKQIVSEILK